MDIDHRVDHGLAVPEGALSQARNLQGTKNVETITRRQNEVYNEAWQVIFPLICLPRKQGKGQQGAGIRMELSENSLRQDNLIIT